MYYYRSVGSPTSVIKSSSRHSSCVIYFQKNFAKREVNTRHKRLISAASNHSFQLHATLAILLNTELVSQIGDDY